ncbi:MAG: hypothetical protein LC793_00550 [Thermomicrobia bacterium]|nr:hypothetical protein [Thermomicrobia bacterium]MCA1724630.1 hypothetical protein [Thermomicrobia bacterium]
MQERETPIEGNRESQATTPTRTGDSVPTSDVTPREAKTMAALPITFLAVVVIVAIIVAVILFALK